MRIGPGFGLATHESGQPCDRWPGRCFAWRGADQPCLCPGWNARATAAAKPCFCVSNALPAKHSGLRQIPAPENMDLSSSRIINFACSRIKNFQPILSALRHRMVRADSGNFPRRGAKRDWWHGDGRSSSWRNGSRAYGRVGRMRAETLSIALKTGRMSRNGA